MNQDANAPFHAGEQAIQERFGIREKMEKIGRKVIRPYMIDQHRQFFAQLPNFFLGWQDDSDWPWATVLTGGPGFLSTPNESELRIDALPASDDPFGRHLEEGIKIGGLGLEFETRRRNRLNGRVTKIDDTGFSIAVEQSFGNCPQYIQTRSTSGHGSYTEPTIETFDALSDTDRSLIEKSDTFFIASTAGTRTGPSAEGADVSHRGGLPGFVSLTGDGAVAFPDYAGNRQFQTLGNIEATGKAGLLFIDFETGDLLRVTGTAEILWDGPQVDTFPGAERAVIVRPVSGVRLRRGMPTTWQFGEYSPVLKTFGP